MRYLLLITTDTTVPATDADVAGAPDVVAWWTGVNDSGRYVLGDALVPAGSAVTVRVRGGRRHTTDGPFTEASETIAGLDVVECDSLEEAVGIAAGHPMAHTHAIEVRAFRSMD